MEHKELPKSIQKEQIKSISPRHRALMKKLLAGKTRKEAGEELGYCEHRLYVIINSPLFIQEMEKLEADMDKEFIESQARQELDLTRKELNEATLEAAQALKEALASKDINAVIRAAANILDRTGYVKEEKVTGNILVEPSQGFINALRRIKEEKDARGHRDIIDATADSVGQGSITE